MMKGEEHMSHIYVRWPLAGWKLYLATCKLSRRFLRDRRYVCVMLAGDRR